ncbi:hypothetical protein MARA_02230 (plasmid) [Mycolicibacterium arabiense]|uniref:Uncharacterized protein n=1 Tax=Mycolicibacterium arabiense TaxID=1286181 RepID=A0A7I7RQJ2_9MYCO|nr:hypothetical protein MARA_02230 [Mycolicibacterium arabiense]
MNACVTANLTDHVHIELLADVLRRHVLQRPATGDSRVVHQPDQRLIAYLDAGCFDLFWIGDVKTHRGEPTPTQALGILLAAHAREDREAQIMQVQGCCFPNPGGGTRDYNSPALAVRHNEVKEPHPQKGSRAWGYCDRALSVRGW